MTHFTESAIEQAALDWFKDLGYTVLFGGDIAPEEPAAERIDYSEVVLSGRLQSALECINPTIPPEALEDAFRKVTRSSLAFIGWQQSFFS